MAGDRPGGTDLRLSGYETGLAEGRQKQPIEERPEQIAVTPSIDDHERTTVWIRDVQHESVGWTTQCPAALTRPRARTGHGHSGPLA